MTRDELLSNIPFIFLIFLFIALSAYFSVKQISKFAKDDIYPLSDEFIRIKGD